MEDIDVDVEETGEEDSGEGDPDGSDEADDSETGDDAEGEDTEGTGGSADGSTETGTDGSETADTGTPEPTTPKPPKTPTYTRTPEQLAQDAIDDREFMEVEQAIRQLESDLANMDAQMANDLYTIVRGIQIVNNIAAGVVIGAYAATYAAAAATFGGAASMSTLATTAGSTSVSLASWTSSASLATAVSTAVGSAYAATTSIVEEIADGTHSLGESAYNVVTNTAQSALVGLSVGATALGNASAAVQSAASELIGMGISEIRSWW